MLNEIFILWTDFFGCMFFREKSILSLNQEVTFVEKGRRKVYFCMVFVISMAIMVGCIYYFGQGKEETSVNEGTLISSLGMELRQLCQ